MWHDMRMIWWLCSLPLHCDIDKQVELSPFGTKFMGNSESLSSELRHRKLLIYDIDDDNGFVHCKIFPTSNLLAICWYIGISIEKLPKSCEKHIFSAAHTLLLDRRSIDLSGAQEKEVTFVITTFWELPNEVSHAIPALSSLNPFTEDWD